MLSKQYDITQVVIKCSQENGTRICEIEEKIAKDYTTLTNNDRQTDSQYFELIEKDIANQKEHWNLRSNWKCFVETMNRKARKQCTSACKTAFKRVCKTLSKKYNCKDMKKLMKENCHKSCSVKFKTNYRMPEE